MAGKDSRPVHEGAQVINYNDLQNKIYIVRGVRVMLDHDLAEIYGYDTKYLNRQVARNKEKFEGEDFMFRLTEQEHAILRCQNGTSRFDGEQNLRSQNVTSIDSGLSRSNFLTSNPKDWGGTRYLPYAFTEQGIYMLMTVLRGDLAIKQSRALVMAFKAMKDYIIENSAILEQKEQMKLMAQMAENTREIAEMHRTIDDLDTKVSENSAEIKEMVKRNELSPILLDFAKPTQLQTYLLLNNQPAKASETYIDMYAKAEDSIIIIDNYIDIKTLRHLQKVKEGVKITIISDNLGKYLSAKDYADFRKEFPSLRIRFLVAGGIVHDRFVVLDYEKPTERVFHCGASAKDAGNKITAIAELEDAAVRDVMSQLFAKMLQHRKLPLN